MASALALSSAQACDTASRLQGVENVTSCDEQNETCHPVGRALFQYAEAFPDTDAEIVIALSASPWHFYDGEGRILSVTDLADMIRKHMNAQTTRAILLGSWTGGTPDGVGRALSAQVSEKLEGFPVEGMDGFLWLRADGSHRVTRQAFTVREGGGYYQIPEGKELFVPLLHGWATGLEERIVAQQDFQLLRHAAIGWETYLLCRERSLAGFELAAKHGDAISAYNAAVLRLERNGEGDRAAAIGLLRQAADAGDAPAKARLQSL